MYIYCVYYHSVEEKKKSQFRIQICVWYPSLINVHNCFILSAVMIKASYNKPRIIISQYYTHRTVQEVCEVKVILHCGFQIYLDVSTIVKVKTINT